MTQLRQENTELKHRLRQAESRVQKLSQTTGNPSTIASVSLLTELSTANVKLKKKIESLMNEISQLRLNSEKQRAELNKEITKLKQRLASKQSENVSPSVRGFHGDRHYTSASEEIDTNKDETIRSLKQKIISMQKQLTLQQFRSNSVNVGPKSSRRASSEDHRLPLHSSSTSKVDRTLTSQIRSTSPFIPSSQSRDRNVSPSSSLGRRFDPTAYQQHRVRKLESSTNSVSNRPHHRYTSPGGRESGYSSADSNSTVGSKRSIRSNVSNTRSVDSQRSRRNLNESRRKTGFSSDDSHNESKTITRRKTNKKSDLSEGIASQQRRVSHKSTRHESYGDSDVIEEDRDIKNSVTTSIRMKRTSSPLPSSSDLTPQGSLKNKHIDRLTPVPTSNTRKSYEESLRSLAQSIDRTENKNQTIPSSTSSSVRHSREETSTTDLTDIDKRIHALQSFLDNARSVLLTSYHRLLVINNYCVSIRSGLAV